MSKLIVVLGATGGQGTAIVDSFIKLPDWRVRGLTRNAASQKAQSLAAKGVEVIEANVDDQASLEKAFQGATAIFAFTDYYDYFFQLGPEESMARELQQGSNLARAAAKIPTLERYIWSTLPNTDRITNGQAIVPHFQGKANVDVFIKENLAELYEKTTFIIFTIFAANVTHYEIFRPIYIPSAKKWVQFYPVHPDTPYPSIGNHRVNSGIFVRGVIENPPPSGTYVRCNVEDLTMDTFLAAWGRSSGVSPEPNSTAVIQISMEQYIALWGEMGEEQASQWRFFRFMKDAGINPSNVAGFKLVEGKDLLSDDLQAALVPTEEGMKTMDWSSFR
ncbi:uncharacterized protein N7500_000979 [Penicillium coprophilum]|uniref:uncharacterized protein n=1 Tax=Penicillium coprophilum TaxID=36646 RepID=UPI00239011D8|nr:uncharacterized protein N7500_000979 [Penicillium coprophilum]KAJ5178280.1 hypothetical protein N7500_000979 [Penicillium coprophilum]